MRLLRPLADFGSFLPGVSWISPRKSIGIVLMVLSLSLFATGVVLAAAGQLTFVETEKDAVGGVDGLEDPTGVTVSPDGKHVYALGFKEDSVVVFSRNATSGEITFVEKQTNGVGSVDGLDGPRRVVVSPDDKHVYVVSGFPDHAVAVFSRNTTTGALTFVEVHKDGVGGVDGMSGARQLSISADGKHLYVAGQGDNAVAVFSRNAADGKLTFVEFIQDGVGSIDGLAVIFGVTVSPDGKHVYSASPTENKVGVFSRNAADGKLTFVEVQEDGVGGVDGLLSAQSVFVSPDNKHVYVAGNSSHAIAVFSRNVTDGKLTFVEVHKDGVAGVDGLRSVVEVTVSPNGKYVYATGNTDNAVAVFSRNATDGKLTFLEFKQDGVDGVDGLNQPADVTVSPDNKHLYVIGTADQAVAVFSIEQATATPVPGVGSLGLIALALLMAGAAFLVLRRRPVQQSLA